MRKFVGSIAMVRHPDRGEAAWLGIWNERQQHYGFITAERLEGESYRECIDREIAWQLRLQKGKDYIVSSQARLHLDTRLQLPGQTDSTFFVVEFYVVDLFGRSAREVIASDDRAHWLNSREFLSGRSRDGAAIDPTVQMLLKESGVISPMDANDSLDADDSPS